MLDQGEVGQTVTDLLLLAWMDRAELPDVKSGGHSAIGNNTDRLGLCLSEIAGSPTVRIIIRIWSYLYKIERRVRDLEDIPHHLDISFLQPYVLLGTATVSFSLIPYHSTECERDKRRHLAVEEGARRLELRRFQLGPVKERKVELLREL